MMHQNAILTYL